MQTSALAATRGQDGGWMPQRLTDIDLCAPGCTGGGGQAVCIKFGQKKAGMGRAIDFLRFNELVAGNWGVVVLKQVNFKCGSVCELSIVTLCLKI